MSTNNTLPRRDLETFERFGIDAALLEAAGVRRVSHQEAANDIGIRYRSDHLEGLAFPVPRSRLRRAPDLPSASGSSRTRRGRPPIAKYLAPPERHRLFFAPDVKTLLPDVTVTAVIVEAEKSVLALTAAATRQGRKLLVIGCGGAWGWKGVIGKATTAAGARVDEKGPLPDFDRVTWTDRDVVLSVRRERGHERPGAERAAPTGRRAHARAGPVCGSPNCRRNPTCNGPDDYRARHDDLALFELLARAAPPGKSGKTQSGEAGPRPRGAIRRSRALARRRRRRRATRRPRHDRDEVSRAAGAGWACDRVVGAARLHPGRLLHLARARDRLARDALRQNALAHCAGRVDAAARVCQQHHRGRTVSHDRKVSPDLAH